MIPSEFNIILSLGFGFSDSGKTKSMVIKKIINITWMIKRANYKIVLVKIPPFHYFPYYFISFLLKI